MKDYAAVANQLKVSHLFAISQTKSNIVMRLAKFHNGPTLHFRLSEYCLGKHVRATQKRPFESSAAYQTPPLVVLNNFGPCDSNHMKLLKITLHSIFPTINVNTVRLTECRRVVLFHYKTDTDCVEMRHYAIRAVPVGVNRSIKKILQSKIPNLSHVNVRIDI
jgi:ribosome biogenesis protein SSF1/2